MVDVTRTITVPDDELQFSFARSGGPGGQNVNKLNTKVTLRWDIVNSNALPSGVHNRFVDRYKNRITTDGVFVMDSEKFRSQLRNKEDCLARLCEMIRAVVAPPKVRKATKPTRASKKRRLDKKRRRGDKKKLRKRPSHDD